MSAFPFAAGDVIRVSVGPDDRSVIGLAERRTWTAERVGDLSRAGWRESDVSMIVVRGGVAVPSGRVVPGEFYRVLLVRPLPRGEAVYVSESVPATSDVVALRRRLACPTGTG